jgi:tRNA pseudouridine65 synthase
MLEILHADSHLVAINKPHNLLVHRSPIAAQESVFALQLLRDQLGQQVWPCHRIDRKTAGVLLFALDKETLAAMGKLFETNQTQKVYNAIVRGFVPDTGSCNRPLAKENGQMQEALTEFTCLEKYVLDIPVNKYPQSRYSLVEARPETGRMHQIRRHFAQMRHYIIGDKTHGECKQNKMFEERMGLDTMLLHAKGLSFIHPITSEPINLEAGYQANFANMLSILRAETIL